MLKNKTQLIVLLFCATNLILHLVADFNSGFQGDEFLHIETGNHPAFGYMEFPPLIGWLATIQNLFHPPAVLVQHIFSHIATLLILVLIAKITVELGGKTQSVFFVLLCILIAPAFGRTYQLFQPVVFSHFFWIHSFFRLVKFVKLPSERNLFYLTLSLAFGFLTKYDIVFMIAGLPGLLFFEKTRTVILNRSTWKFILVFLVLIAPNLFWQFQHQFPVLQMFSRLYETQLNKLTLLGVFKELVISLNPFTFIFWIAGIIFMFNRKNKDTFRPLAISICLSVFFLAIAKSKAYYFYPVMIWLLVFGCIWFEQKALSFRKWIRYPATALMLVSGFVMIPFGLAVLPVKQFITFSHMEKEDGRYPLHFQEYYSKEKTQNTLTALKTVYDSLPSGERVNCLIWGKHYSQAGVVNLYRKTYGLPKAFSYHGSFYLWAPKGPIPETVIAFTNDEAGIGFFRDFFNVVIPVKKVYNQYADFGKDLWQTIYICKDPKQDFDVLKEEFRTRVFE